jgi:hypothetical protein
MKKHLTLLLSFVLLGTMTFAQSDEVKTAEKIAKAYAEVLDFEDAQDEQAKSIFSAHLKSSRDAWRDADGSSAAYKEAQNALFKETDGKIKAMLNDDQLKVYREKRESLKTKALDHFVKDYISKQ